MHGEEILELPGMVGDFRSSKPKSISFPIWKSALAKIEGKGLSGMVEEDMELAQTLNGTLQCKN